MGKLFSWLKRNIVGLIVGSVVGSIAGGVAGVIVGAIVGVIFFDGGTSIAVALVFMEIGHVNGAVIGARIRHRQQRTIAD